jgi:ribosomal protein S25
MICTSCKQDKPVRFFAKPKKGRRSRRCSACKRTATCAVNRWHREGRECSRCERVRDCPAEITDYPWRPAVCQICIRAKANERTAAWARDKRAQDPQWRRRQIEATLRWQGRNPEKVAEGHARRYAKMMADPERHEARKEDARMAHRLRQERKGRASKPVSEKRYVERYGTGYSSKLTIPVNDELRRLVALEVDAYGNRESDKRVREILRGVDRISLVTADRICTALGVPLSLVYPELAA